MKPLQSQAQPEGAAQYRIGAAARQTGVPAANIRYYEKERLLAPGSRGDNRYRLYGAAELHRLRLIRLCRAMDMSLAEVRSLLALEQGRRDDCAAARDTLDAHLQHVRERLTELRALEVELRALRERCDGSGTHCRSIEALHQRADAQPPAKPVPVARGRRRHV